MLRIWYPLDFSFWFNQVWNSTLKIQIRESLTLSRISGKNEDVSWWSNTMASLEREYDQNGWEKGLTQSDILAL
jgi:hypothetical protein